ncbi:CagC family type IV secretion system protein [Staphylococcus equorum]|uniref:CagC family type IV secretion system protein n=1 Tax=Staphylococcus equorum TaxID=246432 RepID=UPI002552EFF9|nr:CagC family type IV secretion system protein [Staphylococcus equorum]MDK9847682.1 CagC family type IV secretion system protein [Staphylococcus equorum]
MKKKLLIIGVYVGLLAIVFNDTSLAADPQAKINSAITKIQAALTAVFGGVGICAGMWIILKKMPGLDDPMTKNEMFKGVGYVLGAVFIGIALVWLIPWIISVAS